MSIVAIIFSVSLFSQQLCTEDLVTKRDRFIINKRNAMIYQWFQSVLIDFNPQEILRNALIWVDSLGSLGAIAFIVLYILATVAFLPGSILTLGAGVVFGVFFGSLYVFIGATLGAIAAFLVG